jgi:predicted metal-dependent hydrolase
MLPLRQLLFGKKGPAPARIFAPVVTSIAGRTVTISVKPHATARRMVLRLARDGVNFTLTVPKRQAQSGILPFIESSKPWMQNTLAHRGRPDEGTSNSIRLRGSAYAVLRTGKTRGLVHCDDDTHTLHVPGADHHWHRRLVDWLKQQAENDLRTASIAYAEKMGARFTRLTVRDQTSRWGSCTSDGALSYSWRLILAPPYVLDYVAAHEVAHLTEMNHSPRFWRLVLTHCPHTRSAKQWLKANGHTLHHGP